MSDLFNVKSFEESVVRLQQKKNEGKLVDNNDSDWVRAFAYLSNELLISPSQSAKHSMEVVAALPLGTAQSEQVWVMFHHSIAALEQSKNPTKIKEAVALLGKAITSQNGISGIRRLRR